MAKMNLNKGCNQRRFEWGPMNKQRQERGRYSKEGKRMGKVEEAEMSGAARGHNENSPVHSQEYTLIDSEWAQVRQAAGSRWNRTGAVCIWHMINT